MLVWVDLETTGLSQTDDAIIEIAMIATDNDLRTIDTFEKIVRPTGNQIMRMSPTVRAMHSKNRLLNLVERQGINLIDAERTAFAWLYRLGRPNMVPMAGSSVHFDRAFLRQHMPEVEKWFHYRNVDVSSVRELADRWVPKAIPFRPKPRHMHRALEDLKDTITEARFYRSAIFDAA